MLRPLVGARFQVLFHSPHRGSFHLSLTVLVRYRSSRVFSLGQWSALLPTRFLVPRGTQDPVRSATAFAYRAFTVSGGPFQCLSATACFAHSCASADTHATSSYYPQPATTAGYVPQVGFGLLPFRSPLLRESSLFLRVLRCFSSPRSLLSTYVFSAAVPGSSPGGFPHSDILGSSPAHGSPRLFAVYHVLLRLLTPRHPPSALCSFSVIRRP